jgi:Ca2+-binding RTX toxin-like protein
MSEGAAGAVTTVDGITSRPDYAYDPPEAFFSEAVPTGPDVYNALDFGAVADPSVNNLDAIQSAIDAAYAAGGGIVYVPAGTYGIGKDPDDAGSIQLRSNVFLKGDGMGETVFRVLDSNTEKLTGIVRSPHGEATLNYGIADITLDGNRANAQGKVDAFFSGGTPGETITDQDVYLLRVEAMNCSGYGFDPHERTERLLIKDCVAHGNGLDGFVADFIIDGQYEGNVAYANDRHGFNITTTTQDFLLLNNIAYGNGLGATGGSGIIVQRGGEDIPPPSNIMISGGEYYGNSRAGIQVQMSEHVLITGANIHGNQTYGVRILGSSHVTLTESDIIDNSTVAADAYSAVAIQSYLDATTGTVFAGQYALIENNQIQSTGSALTRYGIEEGTTDTGFNAFVSNLVSGHVRGDFKIVNASTLLSAEGGMNADAMTGGFEINLFFAYGGDDTLDGGTGPDRLSGGSGNDTYIVRDANCRVVEWADKGHDIVLASVSFKLAAHVEDLDLTGSDPLTGTGNSLANFIGGNSGDNVLVGGRGADTLDGGSGGDRLIGGAGADSLIGGSDADVFVYESAWHSTIAARDRISGFSLSGGDIIDLSAIDANTKTKTNDAFIFIGEDAFSRTPGELRIIIGNGFTLVKGDTNGDGVADLSIRLQSETRLDATDFVL